MTVLLGTAVEPLDRDVDVALLISDLHVPADGGAALQHLRWALAAARQDLREPDLAGLAALDDAAFRARFRKSPVKRIGRARFLRNVLIAIGNSKTPHLAASARTLLTDESPLVRGAAVWALSRLLPPAELRALRHEAEPDADVRAEWDAVTP